MRESARRARAFHEAGHAVAAWRHDLKIRGATILPARAQIGASEHASPLSYTQLGSGGSNLTRGRAETAVIVCLAGPAAQRRHNPHLWRSCDGAADRDRAVELTVRMNSSEDAATAHLEWLEIVASDMIAESWAQVETIASALCSHMSLSGPEILETIMAEKGGPRPFILIDEEGNHHHFDSKQDT